MSGDLVNDDLLLFEANPQPMWVFDRETLGFLEVNGAACSHYGWTRDEFLTMTLRDIRPPEEQPRLIHRLGELYQRQPPHKQGARHHTRDGRILDVEMVISRLTFRGRNAAMVIVTDVTGVGETDRRLRLLVEHSADGISLCDEHGVIRYMSPGAERMFGVAPGTLIGQPAEINTHPDDVAVLEPPAPGESRVYRTRSRHRDGTWRWIESISTNLVHDVAVRAYVVNFRDVTEAFEAERVVRRSEANFRVLIERSPTAMFVHRDGRFVYANPAAIAMTGYGGPQDLIGQPVLDMVHPDDRERTRENMRHTTETGGTGPVAVRILRKDGSMLVIEAEGILLDFDGQPCNVVLARDITERSELFARMAFADRMLSVGTLAAGVAHEINNPLAYVATNLEVLATNLIDGKPRLERDDLLTVLGDARDGVSRVAGIVRDLRALSRPNDATSSVDVVSVLVSSLKIADHELRHRARITASFPDDLPPVLANASRLGQVFLNLLINAAHAFPEGRADENEIRITAAARDGHILVDIEDTGAGMSEAVQQRIFDPFFTTKPPGVGTGLGLSISHQIVTSIGGEIAVSSAPGAGSTFRVKLPAARRPTAPMAAELPPASELPSRVLMIDDEAAVGRSTVLLLAPEHEVVAVTRAREALGRLAAGEEFDVILCDLMMPEMNGIEFYQQLVATVPHYARRMVLMTGGAFTPHARAFLEKVTLPRLEKPFTEGMLRRAIHEVRTAS